VENDSSAGPAGLPNYDELTLPQLRAPPAPPDRAPARRDPGVREGERGPRVLVGMLARRIGNARKAEEEQDDSAEGK